MAGNCNVACAEGHLSLAKERVRVDPKTLLLVPMDGREAQAPASVRSYAAEDPELATPNILWPAGVKSPSNCVFFACHPYTAAVLTSSGPRFGLPCI